MRSVLVFQPLFNFPGKHNVMARSEESIEIFVPQASDPISLHSVQDILTRIVTLALDSNPALVPECANDVPEPTFLPPPAKIKRTASVGGPNEAVPLTEGVSPLTTTDTATTDSLTEDAPKTNHPRTDRADFVVMAQSQAKRMVLGIKEAFGVEFTTEVVLACPNVGELAVRIVDARRILGGSLRRRPSSGV